MKEVQATDPGELVVNPIPFESLDPESHNTRADGWERVPRSQSDSRRENDLFLPPSLLLIWFHLFIHYFIFFLHVCVHVCGCSCWRSEDSLQDSAIFFYHVLLKIECKATGLAERSLSTETSYGFYPLPLFWPEVIRWCPAPSMEQHLSYQSMIRMQISSGSIFKDTAD